MSNYIPHYTKKLQTVRRWEDKLYRLIQNNASEQELEMAVEKMQEARIRALQARLATLPPSDGASEQADKIKEQIEELRVTPAKNILSKFQ